MQACSTQTGWITVEIPSQSDQSVYYLVTIPPWDRGDVNVISCECQSYEFRGWCRHQEEALDQLCKWNEKDGIPQINVNVCPECEAKTRLVIIDDNGT